MGGGRQGKVCQVPLAGKEATAGPLAAMHAATGLRGLGHCSRGSEAGIQLGHSRLAPRIARGLYQQLK